MAKEELPKEIKEILERLKEKEDTVWQRVRKFWFYPKLPTPVFIEKFDSENPDPSLPPSVVQKLSDKHCSPEFINYFDKQTYLHLPKIFQDLMVKDEKELEDMVEILELHAAGHYKTAPFDLITKLLLVYQSARGLKSQGVAEGVNAYVIGSSLSNVFNDIVVNTFLMEEADERNFSQNKKNLGLLYDRFKIKRQRDPKWQNLPGKTWDVYMRVMEKLWNQNDRWVVNKKKFSEDQEKAADRIYSMLKDDMVNSRNWERRCFRFSQYLAPFIKEDGKQGGQDLQMMENDSGGQSNKLQQMMQELEDKKNKKGKNKQEDQKEGKGKSKQSLEQQIKQAQKQIEMEIRGLAKRMNKKGNNRNLIQEYKELTAGTGIISDEQMAERWLYRDLASEYTVKFQPLLRTEGKAHPFSTKKWHVTDPTEKLDIRHTLQNYGVAIPGVTTTKWRYAKSKGYREGEQPPDLYIIFDSSGSMINPTSQISPAVIGGMAAAHSALNVGVKVAVMNFSSDITRIFETDDEDKIDDCLLIYKNGGTDLPLMHDLQEWLKYLERPKQILLITDLGFYNFDKAFDGLKWLLDVNPKNRGAFFCIGNGHQDYGPRLQKVGYEAIQVKSPEDLRDIIVGKAREVYEGIDLKLTD